MAMFTKAMLVTGSLLLGAQGTGGEGPRVRDPNAPLLLGYQVPIGAQVRSGPLRQVPSATVEVDGLVDREAEVVRAFARWMAPALQASAVRGYADRESVQMLGEFMLQDPSRPRPPSVGKFHYNVFMPNQVQRTRH